MKKKIIIFAVALLAVISLGILVLDTYNDNRLIAKDSLPNNIIDFVITNFPETSVRSAEIDFLSYNVWLHDDTCIEFEWNREWEEIERYNQSVPTQLIPGEITSHVKNKYPEAVITKVTKDDGWYEVQISGHYYELIYNKYRTFDFNCRICRQLVGFWEI